MLASFTPALAIGFDAEEIYNSVFVVYSDDSLGSGFAIGKNCIITNAHVISSSNRVEIGTYSGDTYRAFVISMDRISDIAVLGVTGGSFTPIQIANLDEISAGDDVYAIGAPNSMAYTLTKGVVSSKNRIIRKQRYIQTDAAVNPGNSGGPLLNESGEVIGVNSYKISNSEGIGLAIPIDYVVAYLKKSNIQLDERGNLPGVIEKPGNTEANIPAEDEKSPAYFYVLCICLAASVILNIIFMRLR